MKITASMIAEFVALGLTPEQMAGIASIVERGDQERLRKDRDRKRNSKEFHGTVRNSTENAGVVSPKERSPLHPPKEITPSTLSEANASSSETRAGTTSEPMARLEFDSEFWPRYPHKVGKPAALTAFIAARRKASMGAILGGLERYKATIPDGQQWLNPATFLNQERWTDEPAPVTPRKSNGRPEPPHDAVFRALAEAASPGGGGGGWDADADGRLLDYRP